MKLLVWGAGAIGGTIGAYAVRAGHEVSLVDLDRDHVDAIRERGLRVTGPIDDFEVAASAATPDSLSGSWSTVLLCVKAHHTRGAVEALAAHLDADGCVVSVQNGLNERVIAEVVGVERTVGAFVNFGADYLEPGRIHYGGRGAVVVGELDGRDSARLAQLHDLLLAFDDAAVTTANIHGYLWAKLAYGAMLFATAVTDLSIADALNARAYRPLFIAIAREVLAVAAAQGVRPEPFNGFDPSAFVPGTPAAIGEASLDAMVAFNRRSAKTHSGIWRDLAVRKRPTEVDAQVAPVPAIAAEHGLDAPLCRRLVELIHDLEAGRRERGTGNLDALAALLESA